MNKHILTLSTLPLFRSLRALALVTAAVVLVGCASRPVTPAPAFKAIAVIPVASPESIYTQNRMLAAPLVPVLIAGSIANRIKTNEFNERMTVARVALGPKFTEILIEELRAQGFSAYALDRFARDPAAPDSINYETLPTDDAVLHVWFSDLSMDSPRTSTDYLPRVNVDASFYPKRDAFDHQTYFYFRYGTDASGSNKPWSIPSDLKYRYPNFESLMSRADEVAESWHVAAREMARRIASGLPRQN